MDKELQQILDDLSKQEFEVGTPDFFFKCEGGVFVKGGINSLCYTTSIERSNVLVAILNDWVRLRKQESAYQENIFSLIFPFGLV